MIFGPVARHHRVLCLQPLWQAGHIQGFRCYPRVSSPHPAWSMTFMTPFGVPETPETVNP
eukprot:5729290-Amphidinium_carterae.1